MTKWARIIDDVVIEITDIDPEGRFHPDLVWEEISEEVEQNWVRSGNSFVAPVIAPVVPASYTAPHKIVDGEVVLLTEEEIAALNTPEE
jgi:hypothetical protein